jgi:hypothetical protein
VTDILATTSAAYPMFRISKVDGTITALYEIKVDEVTDWISVDRQTYFDTIETVRFAIELECA